MVYNDLLICKLMLMVYFDTVDAFERTSRYNRKGKIGLFIEKFNYIKECHRKIMEIKNKYNLLFEPAHIKGSDILELKTNNDMEGKFDACITKSLLITFLLIVGKDKIAYDYLDVDMKEIESKYLGMKNNGILGEFIVDFPSEWQITMKI